MLRLFIFGLAVSITNVLVVHNKTRCSNPFREKNSSFPPAIVFSIVWPILYCLIGIAWHQHPSFDAAFSSLTLLCSSWIVWKRCTKHRFIADFTLFRSALVSLYLTVKASLLMLGPTLWLIFANVLNLFSYQERKELVQK